MIKRLEINLIAILIVNIGEWDIKLKLKHLSRKDYQTYPSLFWGL